MKTIHHKSFEEKQSIELTLGSFAIITLLFIIFILSNENSIILILAWPFAVAAIIVNTIMLVHLAERFIQLPECRKGIGFKILFLLSNIPITLLYYWITAHV